MIIMIWSQKGGVGKSTLATNLAVWIEHTGLRKKNRHKKTIVICDTDVISNSKNWSVDRRNSEKKSIPWIKCLRTNVNLDTKIKSLKRSYSMIVVDCEGAVSDNVKKLLSISDILVMPFQPSQPDLDVFPEMVNVIKENGKPELMSCVLLTMCDARTVNITNEAREYFDRYLDENCSDIKILNQVIHNRVAYKRAISAGLGVYEYHDKKAKDEINNLFTELRENYRRTQSEKK